MGVSLVSLNQSVSAVSYLYKAVESTEWQDLTSIYYLAESYKKQSEYDIAEKITMSGLSRCENKVDKSGTLAFMLGSIYEARLNYSQAADWYLMSASQQVNNTALWLRASTLEFPIEYQDSQFAQNVLAEGFKLNPLSLDIMFQLGTLLQQNKKTEEAIMLYETLLAAYTTLSDEMQSRPDHDYTELIGAVYGNLATAFHTTGQLNRAQEYYEKAVTDINHKNANEILVANYAILLCSLLQSSKAIDILTHYEKLLKSNGNDSGFTGEEIARARKICLNFQGRMASENNAAEL